MLTFKLSPCFIFLQFSSFWMITRRLVLKFYNPDDGTDSGPETLV
jgi:hypothetical protein